MWGSHLLSCIHSSGVYTPVARKPLPRYQDKMVLCSHFKYPTCDYVHSYSITPCHTPFGNMSLAVSIKQWTAPEQTKTVCTQGEDVHFSTEGQGTI